MSLFVCEQCGTIENTALGHFWARTVFGDARALCSACDPENGRWHARFDRRVYDGTQNVQWVAGEWIHPSEAS